MEIAPSILGYLNRDASFYAVLVLFVIWSVVLTGAIAVAKARLNTMSKNTGPEKTPTKHKKIVISLVGEKGSGKGTFFELLKACLPPETGIGSHRFSDPLSEGLAILGIPKNRNNQQLLPQLLNDPMKQNCAPPDWLGNSADFASTLNYAKLDDLLKNFAISATPANINLAERLITDPTRPDRGTWEGLGSKNTEMVLANAVRKRALANPNPVVVLDGVRWLVDEKMLRALNDEVTSVIVYVTSPADIRYARLSARNEKVGESGMSREQFDREERAHTEIFISQIGERADWRIVNDGDIKTYRDKVRLFAEMNIVRRS